MRSRRLEVRKGSPDEVPNEPTLERLTGIRRVERRWEGVINMYMNFVNSEF